MHLSAFVLFFIGLPLLQPSGNTAIKMTIRHGEAESSDQQTIYIAGDRKRMEFRNSEGMKKADGSMQVFRGPRLVAITRCDLGQYFELNLDSSEYTSGPYPPKPLTKEQIRARGLEIPTTYRSEKPTLRIEVTTTDTGERNEIFGHLARHIITTEKRIPLEGSQSEPQESVTDSWYIDFNQRLSCDRPWSTGWRAQAYLHATNATHQIEKVEFVDAGQPDPGFAVRSVMTSKITRTLPDGSKKQADVKSEVAVTQLEEAPLDAALFEIPSGFKHVDQIQRSPTFPASSSEAENFWQRFKAGVTKLFSR